MNTKYKLELDFMNCIGQYFILPTYNNHNYKGMNQVFVNRLYRRNLDPSWLCCWRLDDIRNVVGMCVCDARDVELWCPWGMLLIVLTNQPPDFKETLISGHDIIFKDHSKISLCQRLGLTGSMRNKIRAPKEVLRRGSVRNKIRAPKEVLRSFHLFIMRALTHK